MEATKIELTTEQKEQLTDAEYDAYENNGEIPDRFKDQVYLKTENGKIVNFNEMKGDQENIKPLSLFEQMNKTGEQKAQAEASEKLYQANKNYLQMILKVLKPQLKSFAKWLIIQSLKKMGEALIMWETLKLLNIIK